MRDQVNLAKEGLPTEALPSLLRNTKVKEGRTRKKRELRVLLK